MVAKIACFMFCIHMDLRNKSKIKKLRKRRSASGAHSIRYALQLKCMILGYSLSFYIVDFFLQIFLYTEFIINSVFGKKKKKKNHLQ